jgi:hypothetical protein
LPPNPRPLSPDFGGKGGLFLKGRRGFRGSDRDHHKLETTWGAGSTSPGEAPVSFASPRLACSPSCPVCSRASSTSASACSEPWSLKGTALARQLPSFAGCTLPRKTPLSPEMGGKGLGVRGQAAEDEPTVTAAKEPHPYCFCPPTWSDAQAVLVHGADHQSRKDTGSSMTAWRAWRPWRDSFSVSLWRGLSDHL